MIKVLTPQQLKEHNKLLQEQLLLDKENEKEEETKDYKERLDDGAERITSIGDTISTLQETFKEDKYRNRLRSGTQRAKDILDKIDYFQSSIASFITKDIVDQEVEKVKQSVVDRDKMIDSQIYNLSTDIRTKAKKEHTHIITDIDKLPQIIDKINTELDLLPDKVLNEAKKLIPNERKPKVEDIIGLSDYVSKSISAIEFPEVEEKDLSNIYTKEEVYNKDEINAKIHRNKNGAGYSYINDSITDPYFTWSSEKIQTQITAVGYGTIPLTNAQKTALTPSMGMMVYTTDTPEGLYVYTSGGRQLLTTPITTGPILDVDLNNILDVDGNTIRGIL